MAIFFSHASSTLVTSLRIDTWEQRGSDGSRRSGFQDSLASHRDTPSVITPPVQQQPSKIHHFLIAERVRDSITIRVLSTSQLELRLFTFDSFVLNRNLIVSGSAAMVVLSKLESRSGSLRIRHIHTFIILILLCISLIIPIFEHLQSNSFFYSQSVWGRWHEVGPWRPRGGRRRAEEGHDAAAVPKQPAAARAASGRRRRREHCGRGRLAQRPRPLAPARRPRVPVRVARRGRCSGRRSGQSEGQHPAAQMTHRESYFVTLFLSLSLWISDALYLCTRVPVRTEQSSVWLLFLRVCD